jgi:hypothetical protein
MFGKAPFNTRLALVALIVGLGLMGLRWMYHAMIFDQGSVSSVPDLQRVFAKAGPQLEATFTNALIQTFPFKGTIEWRLGFIKDPMLSVAGSVDTNALRAFVSANSGTQFFWSGTDANGQNWSADEWPAKDEYPSVHWRSIAFGTPHTNEFSAVIDATLDIVSNRVHFSIH